MIELTLTEVSEILGVSEGTIFKQWAKCKDKALQFGIEKKGRGSKAKYIQTITEDNNKIAYDILREFLINECKFNSRTDFNKLIHYIYLVLLNTVDEEYSYNNIDYTNIIKVSEKKLIEYRRKLTESGVMQPKKISKGIYAYLDTEGTYNKCDMELYDTFNKCIENEAKRLLKESYILDMTQNTDYKKAKDIVSINIDIDEVRDILKDLNINDKKEFIKDTVSNITFKDKLEDISKYYRLAYYEVSKNWQKELGIINVKFYPNHMLSDNIKNDIKFIEIITKAYAYIINN